MANQNITALCDKSIELAQEATKSVDEILSHIVRNTNPETGEIKLSMDELYAIAIRLPAECGFLQSQINTLQIKQSLQDIVTENNITECISILREGRGDAKERQRRAEAMNETEVLRNEASRQIIIAMQMTIQRADKVYEGVKKVIDARSRENNFDKKPGGNI